MQNELHTFKATLRTLYKHKRAQLQPQEIIEKSTIVNQNFLQNLLPKIQAKFPRATFSLYISDGAEVLTGLIAQHFINSKIIFSYPKIINKNFHLEFVQSQQNQLFEPNKFYPKILEPKDGNKILPDILIMPLLAFDQDLNRLGMGGGFYDRTIEFLKSNKKIITIGLGYDFQSATLLLPRAKTDRSLDFIVSETKIISGHHVSL